MSESEDNASGAAAASFDAGSGPPAIDYALPTTPNAPAEGYGARSARGGIIMTATTLAAALVNFGTQLVLAWKLLPDDFGVVAPAVSISALVGVLRDAGAPVLLIERQREFDRIAGTVFWLTLSSASLCAILVAASAPFVAYSKHLPILIPVLLLTAVRFPIAAMGTVSYTRLVIDLRWAASASLNLLHPIVMGVIAMYMAWRGYGVYSLVVPAIFADAARAIIAWRMARVHASLRPQWSLMSVMIASSAFIMLNNLTLVVRSVGDYLTLSFTQSEHETGLYYYAFIMCQALSRFALGVVPALLAPVLSKVKHDSDRHAEVITRSMHVFAIIGVLPIVLQGLLAWPLFRVFLAPKWAPAASLFAIISLFTLTCFLNNVIFQAVYASGLYRQFFRYSVLFTSSMFVLFIIGSRIGGATGVAWANVIAGAADFVLFPLLALRWLNVPWAPVMKPLWKPLAAAVPAVIVALAAHLVFPVARGYDVLRMILVGVIGSGGYLLVLLWLWKDQTLSVWKTFVAAIPIRFRGILAPSAAQEHNALSP